MSTLEDKIMGEKLEYYCSSSEDEKGESGDEGDNDGKGQAQAAAAVPAATDMTQDMTHWQGNSANTGPKGDRSSEMLLQQF